MRLGSFIFVVLTSVSVWRCTRCSSSPACPLAPAQWNADGLDEETFEEISFTPAGTGEMSYAFNYVVRTDVRFRYRLRGERLDLEYTSGTAERRRAVGFATEVRDGRCVLRFDETPFPRDVESADVQSYSRNLD